ncbi:VOC family protein [Rhodobacteraceae bacterium F11138]|nr:VOC family protein [Rhodobacteraceae bacterium F11138]
MDRTRSRHQQKHRARHHETSKGKSLGCHPAPYRNPPPIGDDRWLTVVSPEQPEGTQLLLEPSNHPAVNPFRAAIVADGIPAASFEVADLAVTYDRLRAKGVRFVQDPVDAGAVHMAVLDDTCGNLIQFVQIKPD